jgi:NAD(P) transhydrogenase subunit beta
MTILTSFAYLVAAVLFILGLKLLSSPRTAQRGNILGASGVLLAILTTLIFQGILSYTFIIAGLVIGASIGGFLALKVEMTAMPQMVGLLNGFGGLASTLVAYAEYMRITAAEGFTIAGVAPDVWVTVGLSVLIGTVTFTGSMIAFLKLQGLMKSAPILYKLQKQTNALMLLGAIALMVFFVIDPTNPMPLLIVIGLAAILGVTSVIPIGGADMPVVISLLNSYSGLAAAMTGFVIGNSVLIVSGTLVGTSGLILTNIMCKAMNRSLLNVLFAGVGVDFEGGSTESVERTVVRYTPDDAAFILDNAQSIIIVPGYGLAVAQAQHVLQEIVSVLSTDGRTVRYAIHPVAGRMPGHMNVLLAEANAPYDLLMEMDQVNDDFQATDVALVVGANDVVNPAARSKKESPLYGMPILNVDYAATVMVLKRSLNPGFAGEDNDLFYDKKTMMVFGDAKGTLTKVLQILKQ